MTLNAELTQRSTTLANGMRIVTEELSSVRSVALGFWIANGSRGEADSEAGLSHLVEHLLFKGTAKYSSLQIDELFDALGADVNAGTGKENTSVYARVLATHLREAFDALADMVLHPTLVDVDSEREVILEEIAMYQDDPQEKIFDLLTEATFGSHPLGRPIVGRAEVVAGTPADAIGAFHASHYAPEKIVIAAAGAIEHEALVALAEALAPAGASMGTTLQPPTPAPPDPAPSIRFERKDTEQFHLAIGGVGISRHDDRRFTLRVLDTILGGSSSSRLFQAVRERRGLAYSVYSFHNAYDDSGQVGLYLGTREENVAEAVDVIGDELARLRETPVAPEELSRAKENMKGRLMLALESTGARMSRLGSETLAGMPLLDLDELVAHVDAVSPADIQQLAGEIWDPAGLSLAGIGPDEQRFEQVVESVRTQWQS